MKLTPAEASAVRKFIEDHVPGPFEGEVFGWLMDACPHATAPVDGGSMGTICSTCGALEDEAYTAQALNETEGD